MWVLGNSLAMKWVYFAVTREYMIDQQVSSPTHIIFPLTAILKQNNQDLF